MNIYVYEDQSALSLDPISTTRATFDIRIGAETFLDQPGGWDTKQQF
jgi:hypothetical protein